MTGSLILILMSAIRFYATVDRNEVAYGESFTLTLTLEGEVDKVPDPTLPGLADFKIIGSSQSRSTSVSIINGRMTRKSRVEFIYRIRPKRRGTLTIPSARITIGGKTYQTEPITIRVVKKRRRSTREPIFLKVGVSKRKAYLGEGITISYYLYTRLEVGNLSIDQKPDFSGCWVESYMPDRLRFEEKVINGIGYRVGLIHRYYLYPLHEGTYEIDPLILTCDVALPTRDFFDFFHQTRRVELASDPIMITVSPLPEPKPEDFTGGVGRFSFTAELDREESVKGEPIILTCRIKGEGNIKLIEKPKLPRIEGVKVLKPEVKERIRKGKGGVSGEIAFRFPIIPTRDGRFTIPKLSFSYFDPKKGSYQTLTSSPLTFTATQTTPVATARTGIELYGKEIHYIKPDLSRLRSLPFSPPRLLDLLYLIGIVTILLGIGYRLHLNRIYTDEGYLRRRNAKRMLRERIRTARKEGSFSGLYNAVIEYLGDRYNLPARGMAKRELRQALAEKEVDQKHLDQIFTLIDELEQASYGQIKRGSIAAMVEKIESVLKGV